MAKIAISFSRVVYKPQISLDRALRGNSYTEDAIQAINPDCTITRYGREWRLSKPIIMHDDFLVGKLGFISSSTEKRTDYDETRKDFIDQAVDFRQAHYVQWGINLQTQIVAFETKPPDIKFQSFIGAFKGVLDERSDIGLTLEQIVELTRFYEWAEKVDRITKFTATIRAPNPDFESRTNIIRELLEGPGADSAKVELKTDGSLNTDNTIHDLVEYGEDGYSTIVAHGLENEEPRLFDSRRKVASERVDIPEIPDVESIWEIIINALRKYRK